MSKVAIEIDSKWVKIVNSPIYWTVAALQGVSVSFAPLFLYWSGKGHFYPGSEWIVVPLCFGIILIVGVFNMLLASALVAELRKNIGPVR